MTVTAWEDAIPLCVILARSIFRTAGSSRAPASNWMLLHNDCPHVRALYHGFPFVDDRHGLSRQGSELRPFCK